MKKQILATILAAAVALSAPMTASAAWQKDESGSWQWSENGTLQTGWKQIGGKWYHFDQAGKMETGWIRDGGKWYYLEPSGAMATGWKKINGFWYYLKSSGAMATGWQKIGGKWYFLDGSGAMAIGWRKSGGSWYYMNSNGVMETGWAIVNGKRYFLDSSGAMQTGMIEVGGKVYYLDNSGTAVSGKVELDGKRYEFSETGESIGVRVPQPEKAFTTSGKETEITVEPGLTGGGGGGSSGGGSTGGGSTGGGSTGGSAGGNTGGEVPPEVKKGWVTESGKTYYYNNSGVKQTGLQDISGRKYYFAADGALQTGIQKVDGLWYYVCKPDNLHTGWLTQDGKRYWVLDSGKMETGWMDIEGKVYRLGPEVLTGWQEVRGRKYKLGADGALQMGPQQADDKVWYYVCDPLKPLVSGLTKLDGKTYYIFDSGKMEYGWMTVNGKLYRFHFDPSNRSELPAAETGWFWDKTYNRNAKFYADADGVVQTGWLTQNGKKYYLDPTWKENNLYNGCLVMNTTMFINGKAYRFDADGVCQGEVKMNVQERLDALKKALVGKYFTVSGTGPCSKHGGVGCENCKMTEVFKAPWFKEAVNGKVPTGSGLESPFKFYWGTTGQYPNTAGTTCVGFANAIGWVLFADSPTDEVTFSHVKTGEFNADTLSYARPGDILAFTRGDGEKYGDFYHAVICVEVTDKGVTVFDCNFNTSWDWLIRTHTKFTYSSADAAKWKYVTISRATNYDEINNP